MCDSSTAAALYSEALKNWNTQCMGKTYNGIEKAVPYGQAIHFANSTVVTAVNGASAVAVEMRSLMLTSKDNASRTFDEFRNRMTKNMGHRPAGARH